MWIAFLELLSLQIKYLNAYKVLTRMPSEISSITLAIGMMRKIMMMISFFVSSALDLAQKRCSVTFSGWISEMKVLVLNYKALWSLSLKGHRIKWYPWAPNFPTKITPDVYSLELTLLGRFNACFWATETLEQELSRDVLLGTNYIGWTGLIINKAKRYRRWLSMDAHGPWGV